MEITKGKSVNRDFILSRITEREIFERYLGISVVFSRCYVNPLRNDSKPGCKFFETKTGRVKFNDFGRKVYDCFDIVQSMYNLTFGEALMKVAVDFELTSGTVAEKSLTSIPFSLQALTEKSRAKGNIEIRARNFSQRDKLYWFQYGITGSLLSKFCVYSIDKAYFIRDNYSRAIYIRKDQELVFGYEIEGSWKLYFPERTSERFYQTDNTLIQGYSLLPKTGRSVIITKSYKDVIGLAVYNYFGIAPQSESANIKETTIKELSDRFDNTYILYDNDDAGKEAALKRILEYPHLKPLRFGDDQPKDLTDNMKKYGVEKVGKVLSEMII